MNATTASSIVVLIVCLVASGLFMYAGRQFFRPRRPGESLGEFVARTRADRQLEKEAAAHMHGPATALCNVASALLMFGVAYCRIMNPIVSEIGFLYLIAGLVLSRTAAQKERKDDYNRLGILKRMQYRVFHAWLWPIYLLRKANPSA